MKINLIPNNYKVVDFYEEIWRDIEGYEGLYQVSNIGRVRSLNYNKTGEVKIMKTCKNKHGYLMARLSKNGKTKSCTVHRLVAKAFIPNPENKPHIDHMNTNKTDNRVCNLRWVTQKENMNNPLTREKLDGEKHYMFGKHRTEETRKKIGEAKCKKVICLETREIFDSIKEASITMNIDHSSISAVCKGKRKTCGGFHWKYYEDYLREVN